LVGTDFVICCFLEFFISIAGNSLFVVAYQAMARRLGMAKQGVRILGADCPCIVSGDGDEPTHSVDLRVKVGQVYGIVECKYSRYDLVSACLAAQGSLSWMKKAASNPGFFVLGGRKCRMNVQAVGTLGVSLSGWRLWLGGLNSKTAVVKCNGDIPIHLNGTQPMKKVYASGCAKRKIAGKQAQKVESTWRKSVKGMQLKAKNMSVYHSSKKGQKARKRAEASRGRRQLNVRVMTFTLLLLLLW
jgi:hypothetical protein